MSAKITLNQTGRKCPPSDCDILGFCFVMIFNKKYYSIKQKLHQIVTKKHLRNTQILYTH